MPQLQDEIVIPFRLGMGEADRDLDRVKARTAAAAGEITRHAGRAQAGFEGMEGSLRGFARAEAQEHRTVRILAGEIAQLGLAGNETARAIGTLAFAFAGGFGLGAVLNLAQAAVGLYTERQKKAAEEAEKLRKAQEKLNEDWHTALQPLDDLNLRLQMKLKFLRDNTFAEVEAARSAALIPLIKKEIEARAKVEEENAKALKTAESLRIMNLAQVASGLKVTEWGKEWAKGVEEAAKAYQEVKKQIDAVNLGFDTLHHQTLGVMRAEDAKKSAEAVSAVQHQAIDDELELEAQAASRRGQIQLDTENRSLGAQKTLDEEFIAEEVRKAEEVVRANEMMAEQQVRITAEAIQRQIALTRDFVNIARAGMQQFAQTGVAEFGKVITSSRAYDRAMEAAGHATIRSADLSGAAFAAFAQNAIASVAQQAAVKAIMELAEGTAMLAFSLAGMPMQGSAAEHFKAAALFGLVAATAGAAAYGIGQVRPMTRSERDAVAEQQRATDEAATRSGGGGGGGGGGAGDIYAGTIVGQPVGKGEKKYVVVGGVVGYYGLGGNFIPVGPATAGPPSVLEPGMGVGGGTRETILVIGDPFETPAEAARRAARRLGLAKDLDLMGRG